MAMVKWDPLRELENMQEKMNQLFEMSRKRLYNEPLDEGFWQPPVDIYEDEREVVLKMELPEVRLEDIGITVEDNRLCITGSRHPEGDANRHYHRLERCYGEFRRLFDLPAGIQREHIVARCEHGVLKVEIPKTGQKVIKIGED